MKSFLSGETITAQDGTQYFVKDEIGAGGYGIIFEASEQYTRRKVAVKTIRLKAMLTAALKQQHIDCFKKEIDHCARVDHNNIIKLLNYGLLDAEHPFAVYEYIAGISLKEYIISKQKLSPIETKSIMFQLLEALAAVHSKGIIHGDVKPQNIMLLQQGHQLTVKLFDFGSSIQMENDKESGQPLSIPTTIHYCSPEQLRNEAPTTKSDLYAWGLILLECLTGYPAIKGKSANAVIQNQLSDEAIDIPEYLTDVHLRLLLKQVTQKNAADRADNINYLTGLFNSIDFEKLELPESRSLPSSVMINDETGIHQLNITK